MKKNNVGVAFFFIVVAFVLTMSILLSIFFGISRYVLEKKSNIPMYVFCSSDASKGDVSNLADKLQQKNGVLKLRIIYKNDAFKEMVNKFSIDKSLFDKNPFPYSIELFFEPNRTNVNNFLLFAKKLKNDPIVRDVKYPEKILNSIDTVLVRIKILSEVLFSILYLVEFIVFVSVITILYSHKKYDFNTLKFFGIKRSKIFFIFLKKTFMPAFTASIFSVFLVALVYFLYDKYANIYYINKDLFTSSLKTTFVLNVAIGLLFTFFASFFVFLVNDEKI